MEDILKRKYYDLTPTFYFCLDFFLPLNELENFLYAIEQNPVISGDRTHGHDGPGPGALQSPWPGPAWPPSLPVPAPALVPPRAQPQPQSHLGQLPLVSPVPPGPPLHSARGQYGAGPGSARGGRGGHCTHGLSQGRRGQVSYCTSITPHCTSKTPHCPSITPHCPSTPAYCLSTTPHCPNTPAHHPSPPPHYPVSTCPPGCCPT